MPDASSQGRAGQIALSPGAAVIPAVEAAATAQNISRALKRAANRSRAPVSIVSGGAYVSRPGDRLLRRGIAVSFALIVVLPLVAASLYWGLIASRQYVTEAKFALQSSDSSSFQTLGVSTQDSRQLQDAQVVVRYILGRSMVETLDKALDLRAKFSQADYFSRLDPSDPIETLEKYWKKRVDASVDLMSGVVSVHIRAFAPADSLAIAQKVVELAEKLVNDLSTRTRRDAVSQAQTELTRAETRLRSATAAMRDARNNEGVLDAPAAAEAINKVLTQLRLDLATTEENLATLRADAPAQESPQIRLLGIRAESLRKQITTYAAEIAGKENRTALANRASALSAPEVDLRFAEQQYAAAASAYEAARIDLERQRTYLALFLRPTLAQKAIYPRRWLEWSIIVGPAILTWALLVGLVLMARDHMAK
jgi:capsular polysaccharide transport system permease protein